MSDTPSDQSPKPVTALDEALTTARLHPHEANFFFDAFLNTDLYMPVKIVGTEQSLGRPVGWDEKFNPLFLPYGETKVVPVFDQWERLKAWSGGGSPDYLYLRCHVLLRVIDPTIAVSLNLGTPFTYYFAPDILERLRQVMQVVKPA